jgi:hypothetical protein
VRDKAEQAKQLVKTFDTSDGRVEEVIKLLDEILAIGKITI